LAGIAAQAAMLFTIAPVLATIQVPGLLLGKIGKAAG